MSKANGGPAFPVDQLVEMDERGALFGPEISSPGMTLRDYFAAKALAGMATDGWLASERMLMAQEAYRLADAMLAARST